MNKDNGNNSVDDSLGVQEKNRQVNIENMSFIEQVKFGFKIMMKPEILRKFFELDINSLVETCKKLMQEPTVDLNELNIHNTEVKSDNNNENESEKFESETEYLQSNTDIDLDAIREDYTYYMQIEDYESAIDCISEFIDYAPSEDPDAYSERANARFFLMISNDDFSNIEDWQEIFADLNCSNQLDAGNIKMAPILITAINYLQEHKPYETLEEAESIINEVTMKLPQDSSFTNLIKVWYFSMVDILNYCLFIKNNLKEIVNGEPKNPFNRYVRCSFAMRWIISFLIEVYIGSRPNELIDEEFMEDIREDIEIISEIELFQDVAVKLNNSLDMLIESYCKKAVKNMDLYLKLLNYLQKTNRDVEYYLAHLQDGLSGGDYDLAKNIVTLIKYDIESAKISSIIDETNSYTLVTKALVNLIYGKKTEALELLNKALETSEDIVFGTFVRGIVYKSLGQYDNALADLKLVLSRDSKDIDNELVLKQIKSIEMENQHDQCYDANNQKKGRELDL